LKLELRSPLRINIDH